jgi:thiamine-monophosphate kinase
MLDEWKAIEIIVDTVGQPKKLFSQIGDDVAWTTRAVKKEKFVIKCDMLVGKTDMPKGMTFRQAARKSVVACVSDFVCKGVKPWGMLISLGMPRGFGEENVQELANGFKDAKNEYNIEIVGGDTNETSDLVIDCIMFGWGQHVTTRDGAYVDEIVYVTGEFGLPPLGLDILSGVRQIKSPRLTEKAVNSVLYPKARIDFGLSANSRKLITSSIDSSDGLALSLYEIAQHSHVDIHLDELPMDETLRNNNEIDDIEKRDYTLFGGEEYEVVFTSKLKDEPKIAKISEETDTPIRKIGRTIEGNGRVYFNGEILPRKGWVHLK